MTSDTSSVDGALKAVLPELEQNQRMLVLAPHSTVNTGVVQGDQRNMSSSSVAGGGPVVPVRQGPVRAKDLQVARRRFVPPPAFEAGLAALESGILFLVGEPGTGRLTLALNLLAHPCDDPALVQIDGAEDLTRWRPRPQGVHGYLVMEPGAPFALRPWDLSNLEAALAEAEARLVIVLPDVPGLTRFLERDFGAQVVRHRPPDPAEVFAAHLADICPDTRDRARMLEPLGPDFLPSVLPSGLPPGYAARAAETVGRLGAGGEVHRAEVLARLASVEAQELLARAEHDPELLSHLFSVSVYGGLDRGIVVERAADLLATASPGPEPGPAGHGLREPMGNQGFGLVRQRPLGDILRGVGANCAPGLGVDGPQPVAFFWPAVGDAVWEVVCHEHADLLPPLHHWLGRTGSTATEIERAGRAMAGMAVRTGGRTLGLVRELALTAGHAGFEVAARCLGTAALDPVVADKVRDLLQEWSDAPETVLRSAVAYACRSDVGGVEAEHALMLLHGVANRGGDTPEDTSVALSAAETLIQRFAAGDSETRETITRHLVVWTRVEDTAALVASLTFPVLVDFDHIWFSGRMLAGPTTASDIAELVQRALNEAASYPPMRDALLAWCHGPDEAPDPAVEELFARLVDSRQHGFLRLLLLIERGGDAMPGKALAERCLAEWRSRNQPQRTD
ncbi:hypothetical protein OG520_04920 [Streptomyces sp. NBC_00984]|uniref:hypothetical protein n=1 Tax=Streptomyces sp. NBC_00984 TaxID=2903700 RepID=UPI003868DF9E|nr:hypothetical protein OG520_04920 [Streptomyces sp. NBC_00984]